jgi:hypothetical protein
MHREGHTALVHTAAASISVRCSTASASRTASPLFNIVRSSEQEQLLRSAGAQHVCNSGADSFTDDLTEALTATGTIAFDAIASPDRSCHPWRPRSRRRLRSAAATARRPQAGRHLRRARQQPDGPPPQLRDGLERRRLGPDPIPGQGRARGGPAHASARGCRDHHHLLTADLARPGAVPEALAGYASRPPREVRRHTKRLAHRHHIARRADEEPAAQAREATASPHPGRRQGGPGCLTSPPAPRQLYFYQ